MAKHRNRNQGQKRGTQSHSNDAQYVNVPLWYMREMVRQLTYNPRDPSSKKSSNFSVYSKENILSWLKNPTTDTNEKSLRNASNYMYVSSMHYNRLLNYYAGLYVGAYVISPLGFSKDDVKDNFKKNFRKAARVLELINVPYVVRWVQLIALREGAFYGVWLTDSNSAFIQKIDPDYCKITAICDGCFVYKVDMTKIASKLEFYPPEFTKMYNDYLATGDQWQEVPLDISICVKGDSSVLDYTIPPFAAVMPSLYTIANTEELQETATELKNYKMLAGQIPVDDKGNPLMDEPMVTKYYNHVANALGDDVGLALTPFKFDTFTFENKSGVSDVDDLSRAVSNFWSNAGTSGLLHGKDNDTAGVIKLAVKNDETYVLGMVQQIERCINRYLKIALSGATKFKITILPITVFNREEYIKYYKEAAAFGLGKSQYAAALGIHQYDIAGQVYMEDNLLDFDSLTPLKSTYTNGASDDAGRPESADEDLSKSGENTRANDTNANR